MKTALRQLDDPLDGLASQPDASSAIDAWLGVFARLMRLPDSTRQLIRMELREHLRERVRDLLLSAGADCDERRAVRIAIEELGETAELARRFEAANTPNRRRMLMHATLLLAGAGAIVAGVVTFTHDSTPSSHNDSNPAENSLGPLHFSRVMTEVTLSQPRSLTETRVNFDANTSLRDAVQLVTERAKVGLSVNWGTMEENGITINEPMGLSVTEMPAAEALTLIAESAGTNEAPLDWRTRKGGTGIDFGLRHALDLRAIELVTYDISATIKFIEADFAENTSQASEQVISLLTELVEPENWRDNGGDLAQVMLVGGRLFVEAPSRMHGKIKWILGQLPNMPGERPQVNADGAGVPMLQDLPPLGEMTRPTAEDVESLRQKAVRADQKFQVYRTKYQAGTLAYNLAERDARTASDEYTSALQQWQRRNFPPTRKTSGE
jgi:hypothetical protein